MTNQEIFDLMDRFEKSSLGSFKFSTGDTSIEFTRSAPAAAGAPAVPAAVAVPAVAPAMQEAAPEHPAITAPLVGTFYAASAPGQAPFVSPGDRVTKGQTVCLIEAMKMMSEIPAPCDGIVEEILKQDGELVSFGEPLLRYRTV